MIKQAWPEWYKVVYSTIRWEPMMRQVSDTGRYLSQLEATSSCVIAARLSSLYGPASLSCGYTHYFGIRSRKQKQKYRKDMFRIFREWDEDIQQDINFVCETIHFKICEKRVGGNVHELLHTRVGLRARWAMYVHVHVGNLTAWLSSAAAALAGALTLHSPDGANVNNIMVTANSSLVTSHCVS